MEFELTGRETALVERGYPVEEVVRLSRVPREDMERIADRIADRALQAIGNERSQAPDCYLLGGQPGSGKSVFARKRLLEKSNRCCVVGIDNYRTYHPAYPAIECLIRAHWDGRTTSEHDSPGNDIADFTHRFAGDVTDILIDRYREAGADQIIEWGLRTPDEPLKLIRELYEAGYRIHIEYLAVGGSTSYRSCGYRADIMNSYGHIMRRVSQDFHDLAVSTLASSCDTLYGEAVLKNGWCGDFNLQGRDGTLYWDERNSGMPGKVYDAILHGTAVECRDSEAEARNSAEEELQGLSFAI